MTLEDYLDRIEVRQGKIERAGRLVAKALGDSGNRKAWSDAEAALDDLDALGAALSDEADDPATYTAKAAIRTLQARQDDLVIKTCMGGDVNGVRLASIEAMELELAELHATLRRLQGGN